MDRDIISHLARKALDRQKLHRDEILQAVAAAQREPFELLYWANRLRTSRFGRAVKTCSIVAGKLGGCGEDCKWCAQSAGCEAPAAIPNITQTAAMVQAAREAAANGAAGIGIVNSGRRPSRRDIAAVAEAFTLVKAEHLPIQLCASLGELDAESAAELRDIGVTRYNHNLETSERFFGRVVTTHIWQDRLRTLLTARDAGLSLCSGGIFGLGETWDDRVDLAMVLRDTVRPDVVPLNFLHPIPGTALENAEPLRPMEILTIIAVFRLILPDADIKIAGGREKNLRDMQSWIFYAGATSCLIGNYLTTFGRCAAEDLKMFEDIGLELVRELPTAQTVRQNA